MVRIQPLWLGLSPLCRFIAMGTFEALLAVESVNAFMVIPLALPPEHDVNPAVAIVGRVSVISRIRRRSALPSAATER